MIHLEVKNLKKSFGSRVIWEELSFIHKEGVLGIAGPNGSGKSTLLKCLAYLLSYNSGSLIWKYGDDEISKEQLVQRLGYAAPYINLYDELSCHENLAFLAKIRYKQSCEEALDFRLKQVGLHQVAAQPFGTLSSGQQQRLRLAAGLFYEPDIIMLDEPGSNLDEEGRTLIASLVAEFKEEGKLVFIASNNPAELELCDRVYSVERKAFVTII